jgi:hypothetical protein
VETPGPKKRKRNQLRIVRQTPIRQEAVQQEPSPREPVPLEGLKQMAVPEEAEVSGALLNALPENELLVAASPASELPADSSRRRSWKKWLLLPAAAFLIFQFYYVQEMLAILVLFAGLFVVVAMIAGIMYAVGRAGETTITAAEPVARRGMEFAEEVSRKTFRRPRSAPAP